LNYLIDLLHIRIIDRHCSLRLRDKFQRHFDLSDRRVLLGSSHCDTIVIYNVRYNGDECARIVLHIGNNETSCVCTISYVKL